MIYQMKYLTVNTKADHHEEEKHRPQLRHGHVDKGLWINNKNQSWT